MKVMTEFGHWTVRFGLGLAFIGAFSWKFMSCIETQELAKAENLKNTCVQELTVLHERCDDQARIYQEQCRTEKANLCTECQANLSSARQYRDTAQKERDEFKTQLTATQLKAEGDIAQLKRDHADQISKVVVSMKAVCQPEAK